MLPQEKGQLQHNPPHSQAANPKLNVHPALTSKRSTYINGDAVIQAFANHGLALNVNVLPVLNGQHLHQLAVYVQGDSLGLDAEGDFVPAAVEQVADARVPEHHPDSIPGEPHGVVLQSLVLPIQPDRHLQANRRCLLSNKASSFLLTAFHQLPQPQARDGTGCGETAQSRGWNFVGDMEREPTLVLVNKMGLHTLRGRLTTIGMYPLLMK